jgi:hypothetical protein
MRVASGMLTFSVTIVATPMDIVVGLRAVAPRVGVDPESGDDTPNKIKTMISAIIVTFFK